VHDVSVIDDLVFEIRDVGKVWRLDEGRPIVICGSGLLRIDHCTTDNGSTYRFERLRVRLKKSF
jgi:methionyl-tRNA formyltransferase